MAVEKPPTQENDTALPPGWDAAADAAIAARKAEIARARANDAPGDPIDVLHDLAAATAKQQVPDVEAEPVVQTPPAAEKPPVEVKPEDDPVTKARADWLKQVVAQERAAFDQEREAFTAQLEQLRPVLDVISKLGPDAAKLIETAQKLGDLQRAAKQNPLGVAQALGLDAEHLARQAVVAKMGDKTPPDVQAALARADVHNFADEMRAAIKDAVTPLQQELAALRAEKELGMYRSEAASLDVDGADFPVLRSLLDNPNTRDGTLLDLADGMRGYATANGGRKIDRLQLLAVGEQEYAKTYSEEYIAFLRQKYKKQPGTPAPSQAGTRLPTAASQAAPPAPKAGGNLNGRAAASPTPPPVPPPPKQERKSIDEIAREAHIAWQHFEKHGVWPEGWEPSH